MKFSDLPEHLKTLDHVLPSILLREKIAKKMIELVPELDSEYAAFPIQFERWLDPSETLEDGTRCFLPYNVAAEEGSSDILPPRNQDYIYIHATKLETDGFNINTVREQQQQQQRTLDAGYYHLRTKEAYHRIRHLIRLQQPSPLDVMMHRLRIDTTTTLQEREEHELYEKVSDLVSLRLSSEVPNDILAYNTRALNYRRRFVFENDGVEQDTSENENDSMC